MWVPAFPQQLRDRARVARVRRDLSGYVGHRFIFTGPAALDTRFSRLYPERVGRACVCIAISEERGRCPLIVEWADGFKGIAEPSWLREEEESVA